MMAVRYWLALLLGLSILGTVPCVNAQPDRVISLAPHLTEMVFSAGAGSQLVGVVNYSDYPAAAQQIPHIGNYNAINLESIIGLNPTLILAWKSANRPQDLQRLQQLGYEVLFFETQTLDDIPQHLRTLGQRLSTQATANPQAERLSLQLEQLRKTYQNRSKVRTFYQIWNAPIITMNGKQFISQALNICGAENVFANLPMLAAEVNVENVLMENPDLILLGGNQTTQQDWLQQWQKWHTLKAVKQHNIITLDADTFQRPTPRFIEGIDVLCQQIESVRKKLQ